MGHWGVCHSQASRGPWQTSTSPVLLSVQKVGCGLGWGCHFLPSLCSKPLPLSHLCSLAPAPALPAENPPGSGLGCEVGESARPAAPFLAPSWLLTPFGALISSWCDPCTCSQTCLPPLAGPCLWYDPVYLCTLKAEDKDVFLSPSHTPKLSSCSLLGLIPSPGR